MSKLLVALSIVQILAIGFLSARIIELDSRLLHTEEAVASRLSAAPIAAIPADAVIAQAPPRGGDAAILRAIIREELAALPPGVAPLRETAPSAIAAPEKPADPRVVDRARRSFNTLVGLGQAGPAELDRHLDVIAQLPAKERESALRELTRAMNDGRIDGRF